MKKRLVAALLFLLFVLAGCAGNTEKDSVESESGRFVTVLSEGSDLDIGYRRIFVDTEIGVMYLFYKNGYGGGLTVMVDAGGNPLLYSDER